MPFRTVVITKRGKLSTSLEYLIYRNEEEKKIHLSEISNLIIESTSVSLSSALISKLVKNNIKIVFCDEYHNPESEIIPYSYGHNTSLKIKEQIGWNKVFISKVWARIVYLKILAQARVLEKYKHFEKSKLLHDYLDAIEDGDISNREGHAAKVYFNTLFGPDFKRTKNCDYNMFLNYGYTILLSAFNREIVSHGYLTQLGIHHKNEYNDFNLGCDLIEPFRPIIDDYAISGKLNEKNFKSRLRNIYNIEVKIDNKSTFLDNAIRIYVQSIFSSIVKEDLTSILHLQEYEL